MLLNNGQSVTEKQMHILVFLFIFRGLLFEQLIALVARQLERPLTDTFRQNTYKDLQKLEKLKVIVRDPVRFDRLKHFMYLTDAGLEEVYLFLDVSPGHRGTGFGLDFGDFPYELQRPPKGTGIHHHILASDTFLHLDQLRDAYPQHNIDYRDNRYCSVDYEWEGKTYRFRPDGELRIGDKLYLLEVDKGSEFLEAVKVKFEGYDRYFSWLKSEGRILPDGVIVICDTKHKTGFARRWSTFLNAFFNKMDKWYLHFNISFGKVEDLQKIILREINNDADFDVFREIIGHYVGDDKGTGRMWSFNDGASLACRDGMRFSITTKPGGSQLFAYERCELHESRALARFYELYKYTRQQEKFKSAEFVPVFYYFEETARRINFNGFDDADTLNKLFSNPMRMQIKDGIPEWTDSKGERVNGGKGNPLLLRV